MCSPPVGLEPTAVVALSAAHRAIHLCPSGWGTWEKLAGFDCNVIELLAMCYCLCIHEACLKVVGSSRVQVSPIFFI